MVTNICLLVFTTRFGMGVRAAYSHHTEGASFCDMCGSTTARIIHIAASMVTKLCAMVFPTRFGMVVRAASSYLTEGASFCDM